MDRLIIFIVGAVAAVLSEVFWTGECRFYIALWGGIGMLVLRRLVLCFPFENRALLSLFGALLLVALRLALLIVRWLSGDARSKEQGWLTLDLPSFSYALYRFLLIAPAYTIIEYLEARIRI